MKIIKKILGIIFNVAAVLGLLIFFAVITGTIFVSYRFVNTMAEQVRLENTKTASTKSKRPLKKSDPVEETDSKLNTNSDDFKFAEVSRTLLMLSQKTSGFDAIDGIARDMQSASAPALCKVLCEPSQFDFAAAEGPAKDNPLLYLSEYHQREGAMAYQDPKFRLALETAVLYSSIFPSSARQVIAETTQVASQFDKMSAVDKVIFSSKLPVSVLKVGTNLASRIDELQSRANRITDLNQLRESCGRKKILDIVRACEAL